MLSLGDVHSNKNKNKLHLGHTCITRNHEPEEGAGYLVYPACAPIQIPLSSGWIPRSSRHLVNVQFSQVYLPLQSVEYRSTRIVQLNGA